MQDGIITLPASPQNAADCFKFWFYSWPGLITGDYLFENRKNDLEYIQGFTGSFAGKDILELGPNEGEVTYYLEGFNPRSITSIECRALNFFKCLTVKNQYGLNRTTFLLGDFIQYLETTDRYFDIILAVGVLYHMADPLRLLAAMTKKAKIVMVDTIFYDREKLDASSVDTKNWVFPPDNERQVTVDGFSCSYFGHEYSGIPEQQKFGFGGMDLGASFMTDTEIMGALRHYGYNIINSITQDGPNGPHLLVAASTDTGGSPSSRKQGFLQKIFPK